MINDDRCGARIRIKDHMIEDTYNQGGRTVGLI